MQHLKLCSASPFIKYKKYRQTVSTYIFNYFEHCKNLKQHKNQKYNWIDTKISLVKEVKEDKKWPGNSNNLIFICYLAYRKEIT